MNDLFVPNSFQMPNVLVDRLMPLLTGDEWKVLSFMNRHILGFQDRIASRQHVISLTTFVKGYGPFPGCGLGQNAVRTALEELVKYGVILRVDAPTSKGQRWELAWDSPSIAWDALVERKNQNFASNMKRTASARYVRHKGSVPHKGTVMSDIKNQTHFSNTTKDSIAGASQSKNAPVDLDAFFTDEMRVLSSETPKAKPAQRPPNPWYDVVRDVWHYEAEMNGGMAKMLQGKANKQPWKTYNVPVPMTPDDVKTWAGWYRQTELKGDDALNMVEKQGKIQSSIVYWDSIGRPAANKNIGAATNGLKIT